MTFLLYLPFATGSARVGNYSRNHEFGGKLLYRGQPLEVDPFNAEAVRQFNALVRKEIELGYQLGVQVYPLPPRLELVAIDEPVESEPEMEAPASIGPRRPGRPRKVQFADLEPEPAIA